MASKNIGIGPELQEYMATYGAPVDEIQGELADETVRTTGTSAEMQVAREQGALLTLLARLVGAHSIVEVGTFTGYSAICLARGLSPGGRLVTCDVSAEWTEMAKRYWERAGLADVIELRLGPAAQTLAALPAEPSLDMAFIDADKPGYVDYWEEIVPRLRPGGLVVVDNVFFGGEVVADDQSVNGEAIHRFNIHAVADDRVDLVMLPVADGITIARRRD
jgi:caffeoyl-CoA O-methyltransferase